MTDPFTGQTRPERRRKSWRDFRRQYPGFIATMAIALFAMLVIDGWLIYKRVAYSAETQRLRENMSEAERERTDLIIRSEENKIMMAVALARRQARLDKQLHLSIPVDSARMYLERDGAILRDVSVIVGPEKTVGVPPDTVRIAVPRGERTVLEILQNGTWTVPPWVYTDRGIEPEPESSMQGALGPIALLLDGGTVIYSLPAVGPLADSVYVLPGSVRVDAADLRSILPNLQHGMKVYFH